MAAKHCADIKPTGVNQKALIELLGVIPGAISTCCQQLDADAGVTDVNYNALCYTAIFDNVIVEILQGIRVGNAGNALGVPIISPNGITDASLLRLMYDIYDCLETLTEKLDADVLVNNTNYEALCYTAKCLYQVTYDNYHYLGNGTSYYFRPGGVMNLGPFVNWLYGVLDAYHTLTLKLDADAGVVDTTYTANHYTGAIFYTVEDSKGNRLGN